MNVNAPPPPPYMDIQFHNGYPSADKDDRKRARVEKILQGV